MLVGGFEAYTPSGTVQVRSDLLNFHLRHKFDINEAGAIAYEVSGIVVTRFVTRDFQAKSPVVAVTGPNNNFGLSVILTNLGGNNWRVSAYTGSTWVAGTVWVYDSVVTGTPGKEGIEVYREHTGELAFASWAKPLRIMGVTTAPFGAAEGAYMQVPAGRRYAVISSRSCQRIERGVGFRLTGPQGDGTGGGSSGRFYYAGAAALIPQSDNATQFSASGHFVLIDVTGH
ncbi:TPA: hypothetical protein ACXJST_000148 [Stenotrophomonas maltophilia]